MLDRWCLGTFCELLRVISRNPTFVHMNINNYTVRSNIFYTTYIIIIKFGWYALTSWTWGILVCTLPAKLHVTDLTEEDN